MATMDPIGEGQPPSVSTRAVRPQYHFFYGSTDDASDTDATSHLRTSINTQQEQDSLIGESLVPTDNEEETPMGNSSEFDLQQVLISNASNGGVRHVMGNGVTNKNGQSSKNIPPNGNGHSNHPLMNGGGGGGSSSHNGDNNKSSLLPFSLSNLREHHPMVHIVALVACMTICMVVFAVTLFPSGAQSAAESLVGSNGEYVRTFIQKFPVVDRSKSNDPIHGFLDKDLFHPDLIYTGNRDPLREFNFPFPTGAFWTNLVLPATADRGFSYPIAVYPYGYKWSDDLLVASYPALHRKEETKAIHDYFLPDLTFGILETVQQRYITNFDPLSVALQFVTNSGSRNSQSWKTYLVQGSPYITIEYENVTPKIKALSTFKSVVCPGEEGFGGDKDDEFDDNFTDDDQEADQGGSRRGLLGVCGVSTDSKDSSISILRGVQFVLQTQEGVNWIVFSSEPISFIFDTRIRTEVISSKLFKGTIRLAIIPPSSKLKDSGNGMVQISSSTGLRRLVYHASEYPIGSKVDYDFRDPALVSTTTTTSKTVLSRLAGVGGVGATHTSTTKPTPSGDRVAAIHFHFETKTANSDANAAAVATGKKTGLLMLSLPHHVSSFNPSHVLDSKHFDLVYQCIKGSMTPVVGSLWTYEEKLLPVGFEPIATKSTSTSSSSSSSTSSSPTDSSLTNKAIRRLLADNLEKDLDIAMPVRTENIYGFGKQIARLGQLAHIADMLVGPTDNASEGDKSSNHSSSTSDKPTVSGLDARLLKIKETATRKLSKFLELLLTNQLSDSLLYDASLGGLVSTDGLSNYNADFGNGRYNDHHFHYGYLLYACAMLGKMNATFVEAYGDKVDAILHDVAHDSNVNDGSFFPLARHMSWFDGHSFASGLFPYGNGKSQESSSEAVNCYYGASLWSLVRSGFTDDPSSDTTAMTDFSRLLLAMEVRGARTYWHMLPPLPSSSSSASGSSSNSTTTTTITTTATTTVWPSVYSPHFSENYMVGNLGMLDAICSTWFGTENLYVHMINFLPVTPVSRVLFDKEYATREYANVLSQYGNEIQMAWKGYVVCDHALVAPMKAWNEAQDLISSQLDSGLSKTQALYFIMTSPTGFNASQVIDSSDSTDDAFVPDSSGSSSSSSGSGGDKSAQCSSHSACSEGGLTGLCCPTSGGSFLNCCNGIRSDNKASSSSGSSSSGSTGSGGDKNAQCSSHSACSEGGLTGLCCPTSGGSFLECCGSSR